MSVDLPPRRSGGFFMSARKIVIYDTTLRDGAQGPAVSFSAPDKERIARILDGLGFDYVEGGFPGSNPKDEELFARLAEEPLRHSRLGRLRPAPPPRGRGGGGAEPQPEGQPPDLPYPLSSRVRLWL